LTARIFFHVQHLLGSGHLVRAGRIAGACSSAGMEVHLVAGGMAAKTGIGGAHFHQLPPARCAPGNFSQLLTEDGAAADDAWKQARRDRLLALFDELSPDVLVTEAYPFGRRQMRFELEPLLAAAIESANAPLILCSVRDVLQANRKPGRDGETAAQINEYYDAVLVHGDPTLAALGDTFAETEAIRWKVRYTGMVADRTAPKWQAQQGAPKSAEVLVHAGGGRVGANLLQTALGARPLSAFRDRPWRLVAGMDASETEVEALRAAAPEGVRVEPHLGDLPQRLSRCAVSVSQGGYNTVAEILHAGNPAVIVPYAGNGETEQAFRAKRLAEQGLVRVVAETDLSPRTLAAAIDTAAENPPAKAAIDLGGAEKTAAIIQEMLA